MRANTRYMNSTKGTPSNTYLLLCNARFEKLTVILISGIVFIHRFVSIFFHRSIWSTESILKEELAGYSTIRIYTDVHTVNHLHQL